MKNKKSLFSGLLLFVIIISCDTGFDAMNTHPAALTSVDPDMQLNDAVINSAMGYNNLQYETIIVRQMINPFSGVGAAGQYNQINRNVASGNWARHFRNSVKELTDILYKTEEEPSKSNLRNMARIWRVYSFMVLTDSYGDIPYSEAGKAYLEEIGFPKYDTQESIYVDLLNELEVASAALDPAMPIVSSDVLYQGNVTQWKRLGNSLMLRAAMRLSKVREGLAEEYVGKSISGGLMESNADNAVLHHTIDYQNPPGNSLNGGQSDFFYMDSEFISHLSDNDDPRLASISVRYVGAVSSTGQIEEFADRSPEVQIGMPQGYDNTNISEAVAQDNLLSLYEYSQLDITKMADPQAPTFFVTYAQTQLLLAEAVVRNWATGVGSADVLYENGIEAHMHQLEDYGETTAITQSEINDYILANPLNPGQELEQINTQYWIASFLNGPEAWANFRRSGYPNLEPNPYPGNDLQTEDFIRRLTYPSSEASVNQSNMQEAIDRQGPDNLDTRVWWDVQ